jgi:hypothetical protein
MVGLRHNTLLEFFFGRIELYSRLLIRNVSDDEYETH